MSPTDMFEITKFLTSLGVGGAIAGLLFMFYRKDVKQFTELWQAQAQLNRQQTEAMMLLVRDVTAAITQNTEVTKSLHRKLDAADRRTRADDTPGHEHLEERRLKQ